MGCSSNTSGKGPGEDPYSPPPTAHPKLHPVWTQTQRQDGEQEPLTRSQMNQPFILPALTWAGPTRRSVGVYTPRDRRVGTVRGSYGREQEPQRPTRARARVRAGPSGRREQESGPRPRRGGARLTEHARRRPRGPGSVPGPPRLGAPCATRAPEGGGGDGVGGGPARRGAWDVPADGVATLFEPSPPFQ